MIASSSALIARWTSFFTTSSYSRFTSVSRSRNRLRWSSELMSECWRRPDSSSFSTMNGFTQPSPLSETSAFEILSWMYRGLMPSIPSCAASLRSSLMLSSVKFGSVLPL